MCEQNSKGYILPPANHLYHVYERNKVDPTLHCRRLAWCHYSQTSPGLNLWASCDFRSYIALGPCMHQQGQNPQPPTLVKF